jgi:hypothetical protein
MTVSVNQNNLQIGWYRNSCIYRVYPTNMPADIRYANAPISWGTSEFGTASNETPTQMLDEMRLAGYTGEK